MMKPTDLSTAFLHRTTEYTDGFQLVAEGDRVRLISVALNPVSSIDGSAGLTYVQFLNGNATATELFRVVAGGKAPFQRPTVTLPGTGILFDNGIYMKCSDGIGSVQSGVRGITINYQGVKDGSF